MDDDTAPRTMAIDSLLARYRSDFTHLARVAYLLVDDPARAASIVDDAFVRIAASRLTGATVGPPSTAELRSGVFAEARAQQRGSRADRGGACEPDRLLAAFGGLPYAQREALVLEHVGALADDDIARAAAAPIGEVRARAASGMQALARALEGRAP